MRNVWLFLVIVPVILGGWAWVPLSAGLLLAPFIVMLAKYWWLLRLERA